MSTNYIDKYMDVPGFQLLLTLQISAEGLGWETWRERPPWVHFVWSSQQLNSNRSWNQMALPLSPGLRRELSLTLRVTLPINSEIEVGGIHLTTVDEVHFARAAVWPSALGAAPCLRKSNS